MNELYHYGVKGMRWGVRHDPELVGRKRASKIVPNSRYKSAADGGSYRRSRHSNAKKWVKRGAIIAGGILAGVGIGYTIKSGKASTLINIGKKYVGTVTKKSAKQIVSGGSGVSIKSIKSNRNLIKGKDFIENKLSKAKNVIPKKPKIPRVSKPDKPKTTYNFDKKSASKIASNMNPDNDQMNCAFTSIGYIHSKIIGTNVQASKFEVGMFGDLTINGGTKPEFFDLIFDGISRNKFSRNVKYYKDLPLMSDACKKIPKNSNGILFVQNSWGMGHYVNYEKVGNVTHIIDCQSKQVGGSHITDPKVWDKYGIRPIEYFDCTNASLAEGSELYLNKILKGI